MSEVQAIPAVGTRGAVHVAVTGATVTQPFDVLEAGHRHDAVRFSHGKRVDFPEPLGPRTACLFPWSHEGFFDALASLGWKPSIEESSPAAERTRPRQHADGSAGITDASARVHP